MLTQIAIDRATGEGRYGDVLDVLEFLRGTYGTASNAAVQLIRESPKFQNARAELDRQNELQKQSLTPDGGNGADTPNSSESHGGDNDKSET